MAQLDSHNRVSPAANGEASLAARLFPGSGELAGLIRATDWSKTPLGPVESWPQSLRTAVSICLGSRHPIVLWWGPERWMFYNDAYRPMLGAQKHPQFLGASGQACWAEIWDVIGPMMDQVLKTGEATWSEDFFLIMQRHGYPEETFFTFSYSPILDESGRPNGIFNACTETTARVLGERRMNTLRQLTVDARTANDAARLCAEILGQNVRDVPFALLYLLDDDAHELRLAGHAHVEPGTPAGPRVVSTTESNADGWPLARVAAQGRPELVENVNGRFPGLPQEPWGEPPHQAMVLPIACPGSGRPAGILVLGISPRRALDEAYRGFFELAASHISIAIASARAHEAERERAEKLAELDRAKTQFFSNISHEFRTPLTLLLGPLEDALSGSQKTLPRDTLKAMHRNALRLLRMVNSLLDFSRIGANRQSLSFTPTDLATLTAGLAGSFQSLVESAGLKLVVDCPPLSEPIYIDPAEWEKIVLNLISNAFKFTFEGAITVKLGLKADGAELSVSDTGTGIPPAELPKIFDRFHRVEGARSRSFEGTGIGLALVQELVKQHSGSLRVESVVNQGSTFIVSIPRGTAHLPKDRISPVTPAPAGTPMSHYVLEASQWGGANAALPAAPASSETGSIRKSRVLVADDNADMREYLVRLLAPRWDVEAVADGKAALDAVLRQPPDLVLSDVMMPRMDGVALLQALRADHKTSTIPIVLLSARAGEEAMVTGLETGADDYLVKPFSARELISRVNTHLEMARVRQAAADAARQLAETRAELLADLELKNKELEAFSYSVSHDLRAPLRAINGFSKILLINDADKLDEEGRQNLQRVCAAAQRMSALIDDLLNLSRVTRAALKKQPIDLAEIARKVLSDLQQRDSKRNVEAVILGPLLAQGDAQLLAILLENLIGNAWKFSSKKPQARIEVGETLQGSDKAFYVRDNGAGFDMAHAEKLFAPFQRLHSEHEFEGTGIGLATVHRIVSRHGGRIWVKAAADEGATFYFTLGKEGYAV